uniref:Uncharacterized protein n=1 Tax=Rhizophora mucronata TaxID=61149 RepID=A0A2P2P2U6_RHIMU
MKSTQQMQRVYLDGFMKQSIHTFIEKDEGPNISQWIPQMGTDHRTSLEAWLGNA